mmetsp:Transcript_12727/g.25494  ORF Transcript_12727/g.25494 Transcript_12727/m.25494 type:complete len:102 (-) Transcript_12727:637-942(-)
MRTNNSTASQHNTTTQYHNTTHLLCFDPNASRTMPASMFAHQYGTMHCNAMRRINTVYPFVNNCEGGGEGRHARHFVSNQKLLTVTNYRTNVRGFEDTNYR